MKVKFFIVALLFANIVFAQKKNLTDNQMLRGDRIPNLIQSLPQVLGWLDDEQALISRRENGDTAISYFVVNGKTGKLIPSNKDVLKKESVESITVQSRNNDLFLLVNGKEEKQLTRSSDPEINPTLSPDKKWVAFTRKNDLYTIELSRGTEYRLTKDGNDLILNGYASWVYFEEILGRPSRYKSYWWSPDSKSICFMRMDDSNVPLFPIVGETGQHGYVENTRYPKSGDPNPAVKVGITNTIGTSLVWADFDEKNDQYFGMPYWTPDASKLLVQWMNRGQDSLIIYSVNTTDGSKKEFYKEVQKTWVDLDDMGSRITFLPSNKGLIIKSDKDGWEQLYLHNMDGSLKNQITTGNNWGTSIEWIDTVKNIVYFTSRQHESTQNNFYRVDLNGQNQLKLSFGDFTHNINLSPKGGYFISRYSNAQTPDQLVMVNNKGKIILELGNSKGNEFNDYSLAKTEIIRIPSEDGKFQLPIRITWPLNYDPSKKYPVMINIYGGPNAGTVRDGWQFSPLNQWWAKEGLIQVAMDHRASGHFGKNGVNYMHRNLGNWELKDWITIVKWLRTKGADSTRVGISGFSYGGYMTSLALTKGAGYFTHGLAGGSVTDWHLYDSHYTERFMDTPKENPQGYAAGSIMTYVDSYKGLLRIYHGTMDDNVHMQNSLQLIRKLQDAKKHFEFMVYPGGRHGWGGNQSSHSTNENNMFIYKNLLNKEMPALIVR
ncbi:MAG: DPP IV N-terminal domain-containing protein [Chitinophagaceae bacterium]